MVMASKFARAKEVAVVGPRVRLQQTLQELALLHDTLAEEHEREVASLREENERFKQAARRARAALHCAGGAASKAAPNSAAFFKNLSDKDARALHEALEAILNMDDKAILNMDDKTAAPVRLADEPEAEGPPSVTAGGAGGGFQSNRFMLGFGPWLRNVAGQSSTLAAYRAPLEDMYDHPAQVGLLYVSPDGFLDPDFFEDAGIMNATHKKLFDAWFAAWREDAAAAPLTATPGPKPVDGRVSDIMGSFEQWLLAVDSTGGLRSYMKTFEEQIDCPAQAVGIYSLPEGGLDPDFFVDFRVNSAVHKRLFTDWFAKFQQQ